MIKARRISAPLSVYIYFTSHVLSHFLSNLRRVKDSAGYLSIYNHISGRERHHIVVVEIL